MHLPSHQHPSWAKWWRSCRIPMQRIVVIAPGWPNMPWFWDLVTMSSQIPLSLPFLPNWLTQSFNQIPHRNLTNLNLHAWLLEPHQSRSRLGFSEAVAARIEAPQRGSTRSVFEAKWTIFTNWCLINQVDFRAPPVKSIADFLMYLLRTGSYSSPPLMVTGQPLLINIHPSTSARTKSLSSPG